MFNNCRENIVHYLYCSASEAEELTKIDDYMISSIDLYSKCDAKGLHCAGDDFRSILKNTIKEQSYILKTYTKGRSSREDRFPD